MSTKLKLELDKVRWGVEIPIDQGIDGPNERCIELPLGLEVADLGKQGWVLDAGCALLPAVNALQDPLTGNIVHLTQNVTSEACVARQRASYVSADLRKLDIFTTGGFDRVVCLSTLEHIGCDNSQYGADAETDASTYWNALDELRRVWGNSHATILITVPVHPSAYHCGRWRYFPVDEVERMRRFLSGQVCYYARNQQGQWYGGTKAPLPFYAEPTPKVQQIGCIRA